MGEQTEPVRVAIYCIRCRWRSGHLRLLAEALRDAEGAWSVGAALRRGSRAAEGAVGPAQSPRIRQRQESLHPGDPPTSRGMRRNAGSRAMLLTLQPGRAAQLVCPDPWCSHKPREAWATLVDLAEQTLAAGRCDAYV